MSFWSGFWFKGDILIVARKYFNWNNFDLGNFDLYLKSDYGEDDEDDEKDEDDENGEGVSSDDKGLND